MALPLDPKWRDWLQKIKSKLSAKSEVDGNGCIMWTGLRQKGTLSMASFKECHQALPKSNV